MLTYTTNTAAHAAVLPKISALLAFVRRPLKSVKRLVDTATSTSRICHFLPLSTERQAIAPMSRTPIRRMLMM